MSLALTATSDNEAALSVGGEQRALFAADKTLQLPVSPTEASNPLSVATMEALHLYGGLPRFTPYVWPGRGDAMPEGDTQSSGQQLLDFQYPTMREDVLATQFHCTEDEWQANPMKRLTHWSTGDLVSWMRPPDKNLAQPGSVEGGFYASGVGSNSALLGTAVFDQFQEHSFVGSVSFISSGVGFETLAVNTPYYNKGGGAVQPVVGWDATNATVDSLSRSSLPLIATVEGGTPRLGSITHPRTWYGIWMIRMYGRITNAGDLNAPALNARMDMLDARTVALEVRQKALGDGQDVQDMTGSRVANQWYLNDSGQTIFISLSMGAAAVQTPEIRVKKGVAGVELFWGNSTFSGSNGSQGISAPVPDGWFYKAMNMQGGSSINKWTELRGAA